MNFLTAEDLRNNWLDDPGLTDEQRDYLVGLSDEALEGAIEWAFRSWEDMFYTAFDGTVSDATGLLLEDKENQ